ncbi:MAG: CinA family protein [Alphaproteobacteria bacterium]|nr:CinA family protein [Alphaproteobacteria bacterium]
MRASSFPPPDLRAAAERLLEAFEAKGLTFASAESCTGGLISACLTAIAGSSTVVERGFVTYSNAAKQEMLGVPAPLFETVGAVSAEVAEAMVIGALDRSTASVAVSVTGVAGPGESERKPAGLVYIGAGARGGPVTIVENRFDGDRESVRTQSVLTALEMAAKVALKNVR